MLCNGRRPPLLVSLLLAVSVSTMVKAEEPSPKFAEVLSALQTGNTPKVILDLNRCTTRTAGRRAVRLEIGMRLEPFLAASQCDRHPIGHAPMTTSVGLHYLRSASDQDAQFVRAHRACAHGDSGAKAVRAAPRSLHSSQSSEAHAA